MTEHDTGHRPVDATRAALTEVVQAVSDGGDPADPGTWSRLTSLVDPTDTSDHIREDVPAADPLIAALEAEGLTYTRRPNGALSIPADPKPGAKLAPVDQAPPSVFVVAYPTGYGVTARIRSAQHTGNRTNMSAVEVIDLYRHISGT